MKQVAFLHQGTRVFTVIGCNFIREQLGGANYIKQNDLMASRGYQQDLKDNTGDDWRSIPMITIQSVSENGGCLTGVGKLTEESGATHGVTIERDRLLIDGEVVASENADDLNPTAEPVPEPVAEPESEPVVEEKPDYSAEDVSPETVQEAIAGDEQAANEVIEDALTDAQAEIVEKAVENIIEEVKAEAAQEVTEPEPKPEPTMSAPEMNLATQMQKVLMSEGTQKEKHEQLRDLTRVPYTKTAGMTFGSYRAKNKVNLELGGKGDKPTSGLVFSARVLSNRQKSKSRNQLVMDEQQVQQPKEQTINMKLGQRQMQVTVPINQTTELISAPQPEPAVTWAAKEPIGQRSIPTMEEIAAQAADRTAAIEPTPEPMPAPAPAPATVVENTDCSLSPEEIRQLRKDKARSEMSAEAAAVIGDIPVEMLGSIAEYRTNPVDKSELDVTYCIDKRWMKQGNWFCIDVVCDQSRYFFNAKKGVSLGIPVKACKAWKEAIS